jgi:hypothetical protein
MGVEDNTGRAAQSAASARDKDMDRVGNVVAEVQQRECTVMREKRAVAANSHPGFPHVVVLSGRISLDTVQPAANPLEAPAAYVVREELATDRVRASLTGRKVTALVVGLRL